MTVLDQESIDQAIERQATYWSAVTDRCDFFKTANLSKKNLDAVSKLRTDHLANDIDWAMQPSFDGYEHLTRYRLNAIIHDHITTLCNQAYAGVKKVTGDADGAIVVMEYVRAGAEQSLKGRFP